MMHPLRLLALVASVALVIPAGAGELINSYRFAAASGGPVEVDFDDFERTDTASIAGSGWTVPTAPTGLVGISAGTAVGGANNVQCIAINDTPAAANIWVEVEIDQVTSDFTWIILRYTNATSPFYVVLLNNASGQVVWQRTSQVGGTDTTIGTTSVAIPDSPTTYRFCIALLGTGASTALRCWINPTGSIPDASAGTAWGGDISPEVYLTNPSVAVDTGALAGFGIYQYSANHIRILTWRHGPL